MPNLFVRVASLHILWICALFQSNWSSFCDFKSISSKFWISKDHLSKKLSAWENNLRTVKMGNNMWIKLIYCFWSRQESRKVVLIYMYGNHVLKNFPGCGFIVFASKRFRYTESYGYGLLCLECLSTILCAHLWH